MPDNDMVQHLDSQGLPCFYQSVRHSRILFRRSGVARRMVVELCQVFFYAKFLP